MGAFMLPEPPSLLHTLRACHLVIFASHFSFRIFIVIYFEEVKKILIIEMAQSKAAVTLVPILHETTMIGKIGY